MSENFPNLGRKMIIQTQEAQSIPISLNLNRAAPRHIITNYQKSETKNLKRLSKEKREKIHTRKPQ